MPEPVGQFPFAFFNFNFLEFVDIWFYFACNFRGLRSQVTGVQVSPSYKPASNMQLAGMFMVLAAAAKVWPAAAVPWLSSQSDWPGE